MTNLDALKAMTAEEMADKIYNELAMFPSQETLLAWLKEEAK